MIQVARGQLAAALLPPDEPLEPLDDEEPDDPLLDPEPPDGLDPAESDDPEPVPAATFLSLGLSPPAGLSAGPFVEAVLVAAALESVR